MHLKDEQLNEYLDNEIEDRRQAELHLASCEGCAARLASLQELFNELETLPEISLSQDLRAAVSRKLQGRVALPRSLRLAAIMQAVVAIVALILAGPFGMQWISPYVSNLPALSLSEAYMQLQTEWLMWLDMLSQYTLPEFPEIPMAEISSLLLTLTVIGVSILWLVGNGLLLRDQSKYRMK